MWTLNNAVRPGRYGPAKAQTCGKASTISIGCTQLKFNTYSFANVVVAASRPERLPSLQVHHRRDKPYRSIAQSKVRSGHRMCATCRLHERTRLPIRSDSVVIRRVTVDSGCPRGGTHEILFNTRRVSASSFENFDGVISVFVRIAPNLTTTDAIQHWERFRQQSRVGETIRNVGFADDSFPSWQDDTR